MAAPNLRFAPDYRVTINGDDLPSPLRQSITGVRYEDGTGAADRVEIAIANTDLRWLRSHIKGLGFAPFPTTLHLGPVRATPDEGLFDIDNSLTLSLGYAPDPLEKVFEGEVTGVQCSFPNGGMPAMTIVAHDKLNRLSSGKYARGFGPLPDALIAMILSAENLLIPMIDPTIIGASTAIAVVNYIFGGSGRKQRGQSDLELLQEIAATYDADFWVEGDVLYVARFFPKEYASRLTLRWGESLMDFSPQISTVGTVAGAAMKFTLRELPLSFLVSVGWDFDREAVKIAVVPGEAAAGAKLIAGEAVTIIDQPVSSPADLANSALQIYHELRRKLNNRLTGSASAVGNPEIRAGAVITLDGLGTDFSGDYRVSSASHVVDSSGYRTSFQVRKEILP